jgi:hypothetical protein
VPLQAAVTVQTYVAHATLPAEPASAGGSAAVAQGGEVAP